MRRKKRSKKFARAREERRKQREKEREEDEQDARREFELLNPGVATAEEKMKQAMELEMKTKPENEHEYTLGEHQDLEIKVQPMEESRILKGPSNPYFQVEAEDEQDPLFKRKHKPLALPLGPLEDEPTPNSTTKPEIMMSEEVFNRKVEHFKKLLEKVPSRKADLYNFSLNWNALAQNRILDKKLGPFIAKLLTEYLGQDERSLVQMIAKMVVNREEPAKIQQKVVQFLDVDAEVFVKRMWRMLTFEHLKLDVSSN